MSGRAQRGSGRIVTAWLLILGIGAYLLGSALMGPASHEREARADVPTPCEGATSLAYTTADSCHAVPATTNAAGTVSAVEVVTPVALTHNGTGLAAESTLTAYMRTELNNAIAKSKGRKRASYERALARVDELAAIYIETANRYQMDVFLLVGQGQIESGWRPDAVSYQHAKGIAQFIDSTARSFGVDQFDPRSSIDGQARYMGGLIEEEGSVAGALEHYHSGPKGGPLGRQYARDVIEKRNAAEAAS